MKLIKLIALILAGAIIVALIAAAFMPETMRVERSIVINRPVDEVFDQVADLNNWLAWSPWTELDPEAANQISTPSRGQGAQWNWEGEKIGKGYLLQEEIQEDKMVRFTLAFEEPMQAIGTDLWQFDTLSNNSTQVTWIDEVQLEYPVGRISSIFLKPVMEDRFDRALQKLKQQLEHQAVEEEKPVEPMPADTSIIRGT